MRKGEMKLKATWLDQLAGKWLALKERAARLEEERGALERDILRILRKHGNWAPGGRTMRVL